MLEEDGSLRVIAIRCDITVSGNGVRDGTVAIYPTRIPGRAEPTE